MSSAFKKRVSPAFPSRLRTGARGGALLALLALALPAPADTVVWTAATDGDWSVATNWSPHAPMSADDVFNTTADGATGTNITHSVGDDTINSFLSDGQLILSGGSLTVNSTLQVNNTFTIDGGTLNNATINAGSGGQGVTIGSSGFASNITLNANLTGTSGGYLNISGTLHTGNNITLSLDNGTGLGILNDNTLDNFTLDFGTSATRSNLYGNMAGSLTLGADLDVTGNTASIYNFTSVTNETTLSLSNDLDISSADFTNNGTVAANAGAIANIFDGGLAHTFINNNYATTSGLGSQLNISMAQVTNNGTLSADTGADMSVFPSSPSATQTFDNYASLSVTDSGTTGNLFSTQINNHSGASMTADSGAILYLIGGTVTNDGGISATNGSVVNYINETATSGSGNVSASGGSVFRLDNSLFNNSNSVTIDNSALYLVHTYYLANHTILENNSALTVLDGSTFDNTGNPMGNLLAVQDLAAGTTPGYTGNNTVLTGGILHSTNTPTFYGTTTLSNIALSSPSTNLTGNSTLDLEAGGNYTLDNGTGTLDVQSGTVAGNGGSVGGNVKNESHTGSTKYVGLLSISGDYDQTGAGAFDVGLGGGPSSSQFSKLGVTGGVTLETGSTLDVTLVNGFVPTLGATYDILDYGTLDGTFTNTLSGTNGFGYAVDYSMPNEILLHITSVPTTPGPDSVVVLGMGLVSVGFRMRRRRK